ncbi:MAG: glycosyltransferase family 2 protein [Bacteroidota bacterium]
MNQPLISLITVVYNGEAFIADTLRSAISQTYKNIEIVIIDGGSTDNTLAVARQFSEHISTLISEKDNGIYDAMNKGIKAAKGEWVYFLNVGDSFYSDDVLEMIFDNHAYRKCDFIYGRFKTKNHPSGHDFVMGKEIKPSSFYFRSPLCHQALFTKRALFDKLGFYDVSYTLTAEGIWHVKLFKDASYKKCFTDVIIANYDVMGASYQNRLKTIWQMNRISNAEYPWYIKIINNLRSPLLVVKVKLLRKVSHTLLYKKYIELYSRIIQM